MAYEFQQVCTEKKGLPYSAFPDCVLKGIAARAIRLYEQEPGEACASSRFGLYVRRWVRWAAAGVIAHTPETRPKFLIVPCGRVVNRLWSTEPAWVDRAIRLYQQEPGEACASSRFGLYVRRWVRWVQAGLTEGIRKFGVSLGPSQ